LPVSRSDNACPLLSKISLNKPDIALRAYVITPKESAETLVEELVRKGLFEPLPPQEAGKALEIAKKRYELSERAIGLFRELSSLVKKRVEVEVRSYRGIVIEHSRNS